MSQIESVFGIHSVTALVQNTPERVVELWCLKGREDAAFNAIIKRAREYGVSVQFVARKTLDNSAKGENHQGVLARVKAAKVKTEADLDDILEKKHQPFFLILDGVTDPHNLGACLRNADGAGVDAVIVPKDKSASLNPTVRKVASGAAETMPLIQVTNLARTMRFLQEHHVWLVGTAGETDQSLFDTQFKGGIAIVMGAEGKGMRRLTREHCDELVKLPMAGSVSSLNVSVATGICLYEVVRQRQGA
ncbi:23S rRNA (guanosine(2251)-2'-O)-methyltransferase RlmB [Echinimonas agarilytica]|uniref:23S rRNA (guanosine-2'-O-)-methyltransferase RlmB n=1 Tax=Echinimonas agarilytica TaxID=1215918 RepID=A0AA42B6B8_9GAMM|nr:23S rRNA (guanosine(2251)-2'-O)-methyltransferase RlmB [Echinimonas agarilytica]MCM2678474.1 23S rRNA (guanosine(2251)-2'-O)-methyltransferase RlmB [Echinimonas agarilytica]